MKGFAICLFLWLPLTLSGSHSLHFDRSFREGGTDVCSPFSFKPRQKQTPQFVDTIEMDSCKMLRNLAISYGNNKQYQKCYDTARAFIEKCPNYKGSFHTFSDASLGVQYSNTDDSSRYRKYREWLISVLFLNTTDPYYFCADMNAMATTYTHSENDRFPNASLTIYKYMSENKFCAEWGWEKLYSDGIKARLYYWKQGDTTVPFDSSLHSLDSMGLGFLNKLDVPREKPVLSSVYLGSASVVPNPMTSSTTLKYELLRSGFIGYTIHDALGNQVFVRRSDYAEAGKHEEQIVLLPSLSSDTYYLRMNVGFGEVRTIRMVVVR